MNEGGLGIRSLADMCSAFAMKCWWNLRSVNSLWAKYMLNKYASKCHVSKFQKSIMSSSTWCRIFAVKSMAENYIQWIVADGISFGMIGGLITFELLLG